MYENQPSPKSEEPAPPALGTPDVPMSRPVSMEFVRIIDDQPLLLKPYSRTGCFVEILVLAAALFMAEASLPPVVAAVMGLEIPDEPPPEFLQKLIVPVIALRACVAVLVIAAIASIRRQSAASLGLRSNRMAVDIGIGIAATIGIYIVGVIAQLMMMALWPELLKQLDQNADQLLDLLPRMSLFQSAILMLMVGVYEELLFRGFLLTRLRRMTGSWTAAVLISTAIFAALHAFDQVPLALVLISFLSLVFSLLTIWRRSLIPAIVAHAAFNFSQMILMEILRDQTTR